MHFAYPARKLSNPPPHSTKPSRLSPALRRSRLQVLVVIGVVALLFVLLRPGRGSPTANAPAETTSIPDGTPPVVVVTVVTIERGPQLTNEIKRNREQYAELRGYGTFFATINDYPLDKAPDTWSRVPAMRHAMTLHPHTTYFFYVDEYAVITNFTVDIVKDIMVKEKLETLMLPNVPVVPPDSVIKTFSHLKGERIDFVLSQDKEGLAHNSFIMRQGEWAKYLLDAWFDPLYRSYNFQKAEGHALEHLVQWHGTLLSKLALIPQKYINTYADGIRDMAGANGIAKEGDFVTNFGACDVGGRECQQEMGSYFDGATKMYDELKRQQA